MSRATGRARMISTVLPRPCKLRPKFPRQSGRILLAVAMRSDKPPQDTIEDDPEAYKRSGAGRRAPDRWLPRVPVGTGGRGGPRHGGPGETGRAWWRAGGWKAV